MSVQTQQRRDHCFVNEVERCVSAANAERLQDQAGLGTDPTRDRTRGNKEHMRTTTVRRLCRSALLTMLATGALASTACASKTVNQVMADPSRYRDREVRLSGAVVDSYSFANRGAYRIDDGTGQLWVVSDRGVPRRSAMVTVKGRVREGFNVGLLGDRIALPPGVEAGLVLMESSHKAKN